MASNDVRGLRVAITGGARGIGLATARALVERGAHVAIGDIDGDLDVLVNNAGIMPLGPLLDETDDVTHRIVDVNLHGVILGTKIAAARMRERRHGHVVTIASAVGRVALAGAATYSATKYALVGLNEALRSELRGSGVEVSVVLPMIVNTELGSGLAKVKGQRTVEPTDVAEAIVRVIERPRFGTWVPRSGYRLYRAMSIVPGPWAEAVGRAIGAADILAGPDVAARTAYESRARR